MGRQLTLAYGIAGVAVAVAIIAVSAATLGMSGAAAGAPSETVVTTLPLSDGSMDVPLSATTVVGADGVEYVYVDAPSASGSHEADEHEDRDHEGDDHHDD